ncbi:hypothetical protein LAZ67_2003694 [Cordylochernes scorpioides]|uniref:T-box domain-containing protein n=1 Tax=Cordylochernes scorpioides TaxID=51811 RepID=A0ABY6K3B6_9ARAC|nr:hypothetical protein LAZ67_2003694 [Cordylochernes scorpioides]
MFPALKVRISGLEPEAMYSVWVEISPVDSHRYRYVYNRGWNSEDNHDIQYPYKLQWISSNDLCDSSQWMVAGSGDPPSLNSTFPHPDSPAPGHHWMSQVVSFDRLKLTNNKQALGQGQTLRPEKVLIFSTFRQKSFVLVRKNKNGNICQGLINVSEVARAFSEATSDTFKKPFQML